MWPDETGTLELLRRIEGGDPAAVNLLLGRHRDALRRVVELRLDHAIAARLDASDIVQEALVKAGQRLDDYLKAPAMPFHLWIRQLAKDSLIDAHRRHRKALRRSTDREVPLERSPRDDRSALDLASKLLDQDLTPAAANIRRELLARFDQALSQLGEGDREILLMRHFEQLSNQDAARALGTSESAASMRYLRALRRLRKLLGEPPSAQVRG